LHRFSVWLQAQAVQEYTQSLLREQSQAAGKLAATATFELKQENEHLVRRLAEL